MPGVLGLLGTVALNYRRHRRGQATICRTVRRALPARLFAALYLTGAAYLFAHVLRGYPRDRKARP
ncbi:hypothetical protein [Nocardioides sp.]|uniref:hypothetical protein n=1 Tax=Nocardioides sp. TaxID=35761 RepID=UPI003515247B